MPLLTRRLNRWVLALRRALDEAAAIKPGTDLADRFGSFGEGSYITAPSGAMYGLGSIHLGAGTLIGKDCSLIVGYGDDDEVLPARGLVIGDRVVIGAGSVVTAHESIEIGNDTWFGRDVFISDASHGYRATDLPIGLQLATHRPVRIGSGSWVGHGAMILPGARIGDHVVVGAGSVVCGEVPDHSVVVGVPGRVVRRLVPGRGWVSTTDPGDVRPAWTTEEYEAILRGEREPD
jgi:acetyltransferase-like isoleucine patch superfamily enzyme